MSPNEILLILGMTTVTFLPRYIPMLVVGRIPLPESLFRALRYVPVAVLTAISVPEALMPLPSKTISFALSNAHLYGSIAAILIAWRFKNLLATIVGGMLVFFVWRFIFGI